MVEWMPEGMLDFLDEEWERVSLPALIGWGVFYALFMGYALRTYAQADNDGFLFIDNANLVVHEGGHLLFGWFGQTIGLWGGTLLQWLVPLMLAGFFFVQRKTTGFVFCMFFFFENWLYTSWYMGDARAMVLPLVTVGDADQAGHDWNLIFSSLGLLQYDTRIAAVVRAGGWLGMASAVAWLGWRYMKDREAATADWRSQAAQVRKLAEPVPGSARWQGPKVKPPTVK